MFLSLEFLICSVFKLNFSDFNLIGFFAVVYFDVEELICLNSAFPGNMGLGAQVEACLHSCASAHHE
jgi:hypothetical protein